MSRVRPLIVATSLMMFLASCNTPPGVTVKELREEHEKVEKALRERAQMALDFADQKIKAVDGERKATMARVQQMADANYEAELANRRNPQQNNSTYIVAKNTALVAANSPVPVSATAIREAEERVPKAEAAKSTAEIDTFYKGKFEEADKALTIERKAKEKVAELNAEQEKQLRQKEREVETRYRAGMERAQELADRMATQLDEATQKLYKQLVWLFGAASVLAAGLAFWCFYGGNFRMGYYGLAGAALLGGAAFLAVWLHANQWVVWVLGAVGICALAAMLVVKQGWLLRNGQLVGFAAKRATMVRFIQEELKKTLQDFGMAAGETMETLDLHEVELLQDKLVAWLKKEGKAVPAFLRD